MIGILARRIRKENRIFCRVLPCIGLLVGYLLLFLMFLIRDLDNPFGYYEGGSSEDVSLKPLEEALSDLRTRVQHEYARSAGFPESSQAGGVA